MPNIEYININEDNYYIIDRGLAKRNSMVKISDTKFAILLNEFTNSSLYGSFNKNLLILIFNIFDNSKISIRHYKINFELYNLLIFEDIKGYTLNNFFGVLLETIVTDTENYQPKAIFLTFGYVNSTYKDNFVDKNLKNNNTNSIVSIRYYLSEIENNLFAYKYIGVKILSLPPRLFSGYFINNKTNEEIKVGDMLSFDSNLRFILVRQIISGDLFNINFAVVVQEPDFDLMNNNAERVDIYPINDTNLEKEFYSPKNFIGRVIQYKFDLDCYDSCEGCFKLSNNPDDQQCIHCKKNYFFQEGTNNCFESKEGYYLDIKTKQLLPCHSSCSTCNGPQTKNSMNCLSCKEGLNLYESKNCLNCPKYVNYLQTECIDTIPDGYFLLYKNLGILGKCHKLCKTCEEAPTLSSMNCKECKYNDTDFIPSYEGECPNKENDGEEEEEEEIIMPEGKCPRSKPILVINDFCFDGYCSPEQFKDETCVISNSIIKDQWMNNIQRFGNGNTNFISLDYGFYGELFLFGQRRENSINQNNIYGVDKYGEPFFYNATNDKYYYYHNIDFPNDIFLEKVRFVRNYESDNIYLLSTQKKNEMYAVDYEADKNYIYKFDYTSYSTNDIIALKQKSEEFVTYFIYCKDDTLKECYPFLRKFKIETDKHEIKIIKEYKDDISINPESNFICNLNYDNYIQCIYSKINDNFHIYSLSFYSSDNFQKVPIKDLDLEFETQAFLNSIIILDDDKTFVMAFLTDNNIIKIFIKKIIDFTLNDYIDNVSCIDINEDNYYDFRFNQSDRNSLCKINNDKFAMMVNYFNELPMNTNENPNILIYIFTIFNEHKNINIRKYSINFKLYNSVNIGKILGYNLGQFFGIFIELSNPDNKTIVNSAFMTFGYSNATNSSRIIDKEFIPENSLLSRPIKLGNYIGKIENNLFGYDSLKAIIISLPDEKMGYFFINNDEKIIINQTLDLNTEIRLKINETYKPGNYSLHFASIVKEPVYDKLNKYTEEIIRYPKDTIVDESEFYTPKYLIGKRFIYNFEIKGDKIDDDECYPSCSTCYSKTKDYDNHQCIKCKDGYYFKENTHNCYKEIDKYYYFNKEQQVFSRCFIDCLTCDDKEKSPNYMNCLSCDENYKYYKKSKNCLKCSKYVNYLQTECIDTIPDGYYLSDESSGIINKCHNLCKTCEQGPYTLGQTYYMNCKSCLYTDNTFIPKSPGDCPSSDREDKDDEPINNQCPRHKPILKDNKCKNIYCTKEEFENKVCLIYNDYTKIQWFNNFHIFSDLSNDISYDINDKGDLFLMAQKEEEDKYKQILYGFKENGTAFFYNKTNDKYYSFKTNPYQFSSFVEKIKYIEINNEGYLINIVKDLKIYLYDYNNDEVYSQLFLYSLFTFDTIIKLKNKNNIYFFSFIYCLNELTYDNCYIGFVNYRIEKKNMFQLEKTNSDDLLKVNYNTKLMCFENSYNLQCKYTVLLDEVEKATIYKHIITLFNPDTFEIIKNFNLDIINLDFPFFDSMIQLKENVFVIAYSITSNTIQILFKEILLDGNNFKFENYINSLFYININEDSIYDLANKDPFSNDLFKLNENEFVMLLNDYKNADYARLNTGLVIITFHIYNNNRNIIVRHYKIDFSLYNMNMFIDGDVKGYKLGGFFGTLIELTSPSNKYINRAAFLTFGYVNATDDVSSEEGTNNLIDNKKNIKINDYISGIENNLFGYEFIGVKILTLPDENKVGYFVNIKNNKKINIDEIIDINSELSFKVNNNPIIGKYLISFAGVVKEPEYKKANNFANKVEFYPNSSLPENNFDEQKTLIGKEFKYNFAIKDKKEEPKCYENCETCIRPSNNINEQDCITCKKGFYFKDGTNNCYDKIEYQYYFNKETNTFSPCYKDCYTCNTKEIDSNNMNCLSCHKLYNFYEKSKNCLKCPKYVNYLQTGCIDTIPDGYYLSDENRGIIEKCHYLCKTCKTGPKMLLNQVNMNCVTCLYDNNLNQKLIEGNCPDSSDDKANKNDIKKKKNYSENNISSLIIILSIIFVILVASLIGIIIYMKFCRKKQELKKSNSYYYNIGKIIPFEDEK